MSLLNCISRFDNNNKFDNNNYNMYFLIQHNYIVFGNILLCSKVEIIIKYNFGF